MGKAILQIPPPRGTEIVTIDFSPLENAFTSKSGTGSVNSARLP